MTFEQLKESVEDRVKLLEDTTCPGDEVLTEEVTARMQEARVILDMINLVDAEREEKLYPCDVEYDPDRYDPGRC